MDMLLAGIGFAGGLMAAALAIESRREGETFALRRARDLGLAWTALWLALAWLPIPGAHTVGMVLAAALGLLIIAVLIPTGRPHRHNSTTPGHRLDERTVMFSRAALEQGSAHSDSYYADHPEHRDHDDAFRALPGLLGPDAHRAEPVAFAAASASFDTVKELAALVEGEPADDRHDMAPETATRFLKGWARKLGAHACGVTRLRSHHLYSHKGRGPRWGEAVTLDHTWAVAFTVEMDFDTLGTAPEAPTVMESAQQYLNSGTIAVQLAQGIRRLGWPAEAHIDANYQVVCPLVARDAGLGEIGRMGLLMTPGLGPRVRIAVVTTDLPLVADPPADDPTVEHFCSLCRKCADICPAQAIPAGAPQDIAGLDRWQINQEACFTYWCRSGTDCGQCVRVCPYAHPDSPLHNLVRRGLGHSALIRHLALRLDDVLYGRRPAPKPIADWLPGCQNNSD
ncbi:hypothetical protein DRQ50_09625 [bacterium]|nr:MAG: hypothetical protein DRQ50_09625 [bacterium]